MASNNTTPGIRSTYIVSQGDTPTLISTKIYAGNPSLWRQLFDFNGITDPRNLTPGMILAIPPRT